MAGPAIHLPAAKAPARAPARPAAPTSYQLAPGFSISANNPLLTGAPLQGPAIVQAAKGLANAATAPTISGLQQQIGQNNAQTRGALGQVGGYYTQLGNLAKQGVTDEGNIASGLNTQLQGIGNEEQSQLQGIGNDALASLAKYTPGGQNVAASSLAAEIARQQGLAAQQQGAFRSFGATQGANYQGAAAGNLGVDALAGTEALRNIAQAGEVRNEPLMSKLANAIATRGADTETALGKLYQQNITNSIAKAGLGIRQTQANAALYNAQTNRINAGTRQQAVNVTAQNDAFNRSLQVGSPAWERVQNAQGKAWSDNPHAVGSPAWGRVQTANRAASKGSGGPKPLSTLENNTWLGKLGTVEQLIRDGQKHGGSNQQITAHLQDGRNPFKGKYDPNMIQAAWEILGYGMIQPNTAQILENNYGVRLPGNIRVGNPPPAKPPAGGLFSGATIGQALGLGKLGI